MPNIPFFSLDRQYRSVKTEIQKALVKTLNKGIFSLGEEVDSFEKEFARYLGVKYAVGVASGTDALTLCMKALGLDAHDEVVLPANSYPSVFGIALSGVKIRLVDCDENGLLDLNKLEKSISSKTKAIIPVHMYGNPVDIFTLKEIISKFKHQIYIVEDAAQAHGACIKDTRVQKSKVKSQNYNSNVENNFKKVGGIGDLGIFSFYPTKNLGAYGDGGMVVTNDSKLNERLRQLRQYGEVSRYHSIVVSGVSRLDEIQASVLRIKLKFLDKWNTRRSQIADYYQKKLEGVGDIRIISKVKSQKSKVQLKNSNNNTKTCNHLLVIKTKKRDQLKEFLDKNGVGTAIHYPVPIHLTKSFISLGYKKGDFPVSEKLANEVLSLPLFPELTDLEISSVYRIIESFFKSGILKS